MMAPWNVFRAPVLVMLRRTLPWHAVCVARASYKVLACSHIPPVRFQNQYRTSTAPTELQKSHQIRTTENPRWNLKESQEQAIPLACRGEADWWPARIWLVLSLCLRGSTPAQQTWSRWCSSPGCTPGTSHRASCSGQTLWAAAPARCSP